MTRLTFDEYQKRARETALSPEAYPIVGPALDLAGKTGAVCEKVKMTLCDPGGAMGWEALAQACGDLLGDCAALADDLNISLSDVIDDDVMAIRYQRHPHSAVGASFKLDMAAGMVSDLLYLHETGRLKTGKLKLALAPRLGEVMRLLPEIARGYSLEAIARAGLESTPVGSDTARPAEMGADD